MAKTSFFINGNVYDAFAPSDSLLAALNAAVATAVANRETGFGLAIAIPGSPLAASEWLFGHKFDVAVNFAVNFGGSYAVAGAAPTGTAALSVNKNGTPFGTITFSGSTVTFSAPATSFAIGDLLEIIAPASADATLAKLAITLFGTRP